MKNLTVFSEDFYESNGTCYVKLGRRKIALKLCVEIIDLENAAGEEGFLVTSSFVIASKSLTANQRRKVMTFGGGNVALYDIQQYGYCVMFASERFQTKEQAIAHVQDIDKNVSIIFDQIDMILDRPVNHIGNTGWYSLNRQFMN
jgi:hypothetical protein